MKNAKSVLLVFTLLVTSGFFISTSTVTNSSLVDLGETQQVLISFDSFYSKVTSGLDRLNIHIDREFHIIPTVEATVPTSLIPVIERLPGVQAVQPNQIYTVDVVPNDPGYSQLWGMDKISAPAAWDIITDASTVVVAVVDTGVQITHPDLAANIWTNPGEIPGNGIDDDGNGYVDDVNGWDFFNNDNTVYDSTADDHGTHVSGTIGAVGNNGKGVAGVSWKVKIMPLKFLGANGGSTADAISAIEYATMMGADIISASWGGGGYDQALKNAIDAFPGLFVAAAGNSAVDNDASPHYPSSYSSPNLIAVASTTSSDGLSSFSNWGANSVDIGAPGSNIYSTWPSNSYNTISGTSMATPHVSGAAALLLANDPTLTATQLKAKLMDFADPIPALQGKTVSGGRLNVYASLTGTAPPPPPPPPPSVTETFTGSVSSGSPDQVFTFDVPEAGDISATLSWGTSADLDMYLYAPGSDPYGNSWVTRAYTLNNPETINYAASQTGIWSIRVNHYSGVSSSFTLDVTHPGSTAPDTTPPSVTINSPSGTVSGTVTVDATITDDVGVTSADYRIDGGAWKALSGSGNSWTASLDTTTLADGSHTIDVRGLDAAGNVGTSSGSFTVNNAPPADTQAPSVTINSPSGTVSGTVTVDATITDNVGVTSADYRIDGGAWKALSGSGNSWTASLDTTTLADGSHTIDVRGFDAAGNVGTSSGSFTVNNAPPSSSVSMDSHTESVDKYDKKKQKLKLWSEMTGTVSGSPSSIIISFEVPNSWSFKKIKDAFFSVNGGAEIDVKSMVTQSGNVISIDITNLVGDGDSFYLRIRHEWKNVQRGTYSITASLSYNDGVTTQVITDVKNVSF